MSKRPGEIGLSFRQAPPAAVEAGIAFDVTVQATWPGGISRNAAVYALREEGRTVCDGALPKLTEGGDIVLTLCAPEEVGDHKLTLLVKAERAEGALPFVLRIEPHATSLAVWDVPSPVVRGARFEIKAGAKCAASCGLAGKVIEIRDEAGKVIGSETLGAATFPGTTALYFTTIALKAPRKLALNAWTVSFAPSELKLPHGGARATFSFVTTAEPEHSVSLTVVNKQTKAPVVGAQVRLGVYRAVTDEKGSAKVRVPKGVFPLVVSRVGYAVPERDLEVAKDIRLRITAEKLPEEDPYALWTA